MENRRFKHAAKSIVSFVVRLSLRWKISLSILVAFIIIIPSVSLSLFYFTGLLNTITIITDRDVKLGRIATELSLDMLDIRRYERNYRMFGSSAERESVQRLIAHADSVLVVAREIAPESEKTVLEDLANDLDIYLNTFMMLVEHIAQNPPETNIQQKVRLTRRLNDFHAAYGAIIAELDSVTPAERDSVLAKANQSLDIFSVDLLAMSDRPGQPSYIQENLERSRQAFLASAQELAEHSWAHMRAHRIDSQRIEARAKRNIISVLIVTGIVCVFMIAYLPRYIVRPITKLNRIFRKAEEGDLKVLAPVQSHDEIGDLAHSFNRMIERLSLYDDLKTRKIALQKRIFDRFMETLDVPACILTKEFNALFYNAPFSTLFGGSIPPKPPDGGLDTKQVADMGPFVDELKKRLAENANNLVIEFKISNGGTERMKGRVVRNALMKIESVVLIDAPAET